MKMPVCTRTNCWSTIYLLYFAQNQHRLLSALHKSPDNNWYLPGQFLQSKTPLLKIVDHLVLEQFQRRAPGVKWDPGNWVNSGNTTPKSTGLGQYWEHRTGVIGLELTNWETVFETQILEIPHLEKSKHMFLETNSPKVQFLETYILN